MLLRFTSVNESREKFISALKWKPGLTHTIDRSNLFDSVNQLYWSKQQQILTEYPFRTHFANECGVDFGGVSRDMFSGYYEEMYKKVLDGATLLYPVMQPHLDFTCLPVIGTVMSHAYIFSGILLVRMAFPCLAQCLLGQTVSSPDSVLVESFIDTMSPYESSILRDTFSDVKRGSAKFSASMQSSLLTSLSRFGKKIRCYILSLLLEQTVTKSPVGIHKDPSKSLL